MTQEDRDSLFVDCYSQFHKFVYNYCHRFITDNEDRADVVHDAFIRVYKSLHRFDRKKAKINTWIFCIARNACLDYIRAKAYKARSGFVQLDHVHLESKYLNPENMAIQSQRGQRLEVAIMNLSKMQREEMKYLLSGYRTIEIAEKTNRAHSTVRQSIKRSKNILQEVLKGKV